MKTIPYLTQYFNYINELDNKGINIDNATESQIKLIKELQIKAIEQSGLSWNELTLICLCRKHRIFTKVNVYANKIKSN